MQGCYVEVVFNYVAKVPSQSCSCAVLVLISLHPLSFFKMFFIILYNISTYTTGDLSKFLAQRLKLIGPNWPHAWIDI